MKTYVGALGSSSNFFIHAIHVSSEPVESIDPTQRVAPQANSPIVSSGTSFMWFLTAPIYKSPTSLAALFVII